MSRTRIKICGMREPGEVAQIVAAGVDAVGFIFAKKSPRYIEPEQAKAVIKTLPPFVDAVGVFVDEELEAAQEISQYCGLSVVQLHGNEPPDYCREMTCRVMKAFRVGVHSVAQDLAPYAGVTSGFLLDTYQEKMAGGTGETFDWSLIEKVQPPGPIVLAGGLHPENVGEAVRRVRPHAVDLNSGVEIEPGRKDLEKVRAAVAQIKAADDTA